MTVPSMTISALMHNATARLAPSYGSREAAALTDEILLRLKGWNRVDSIIHGNELATQFLADRVDATVDRILNDEPIQYIFGKAHFYGMDFNVSPATLIPRQETAMLVDMIVDRYGKTYDLNILDLGTGSGCIAIALARHLPFPSLVNAVDISPDALNVARSNALALNTRIDFVNADMLSLPDLSRKLSANYDIIVSNPPYIARHEAASMHRNVLDFEPDSALFVPDDDPLIFYRAIAEFASSHLAPDGGLFLEINPLFAKDLTALLCDFGFTSVDTFKDLQKADRFIIAYR